ncbi:NAD-dependent epimerase/dehydratase family protein [Halobium salinum]|uniref:NAD-dependent epimerase/dehydratase family protein n=1 Tax=Halobium salinum TaxID=1364940 RepID=A0ABD5P9Z0_9EURY|nr:NAD-dependent epimerase/dehydratase family protein [Halobium salinum]
MNSIGPVGKRVLVTGGAGFIGSHLVDALVPDNDVVVLDSLASGDRANVHDDAELVEGDLRDEDALDRATEDVDVIYHQGAVVAVSDTVEDPTRSNAVNVDATLSLLERARDEDARIVLASSAAIYGDPESVPVHEDDPKTPSSPYGVQKLTLDHYAQVYHDLYGLETVPLRYFNVYGPRQGGSDYAAVISVFLQQAREGGPITIEGDGEQTRDFVFVEDVVRANLLAATTDAVGEPFNVATGEQTTILDIADAIVGATGSDAEITHVDPRVGDIRHSRADVSRAKETLDFEATVELEEGISRLVESTRA